MTRCFTTSLRVIQTGYVWTVEKLIWAKHKKWWPLLEACIVFADGDQRVLTLWRDHSLSLTEKRKVTMLAKGVHIQRTTGQHRHDTGCFLMLLLFERVRNRWNSENYIESLGLSCAVYFYTCDGKGAMSCLYSLPSKSQFCTSADKHSEWSQGGILPVNTLAEIPLEGQF